MSIGIRSGWIGPGQYLKEDGIIHTPKYISVPSPSTISNIAYAKTMEICTDDIANIFETETHFIFIMFLTTGIIPVVSVKKNENVPDYHMMVYKRPSDWKKMQKMADDIEKLTEHVKTLMIGNDLLPMDYCGAFP